MLQPSLRHKRIRLARLTDDPCFSRALTDLLQDRRDTALPTSRDLDQRALITPADVRAALRLWADARDAHPDADPVEALAATAGRRLADEAAGFRSGKGTAAAWMAALLTTITAVHVAAAVFAYGGTSAMTPVRWHIVSQIIRQQYAYAVRFVTDVLEGRQRRNGRMDVRAALYARAARTTAVAITRRVAYESGMRFERNMLGATDATCAACQQQADLGWVVLGTLSQPGTRSCMSNCRCTIQFSAAPSLHSLQAAG